MTDFASDSFTDTTGTALEAHTADVGGTWSVLNDAGSFHITSDALYSQAFGSELGWLTATPPSADYDVECTITALSPGCGWSGGPVGRFDGSGAGYWGEWVSSVPEWRLILESGGLTTLGSSASLPVTSSRVVTLHMAGPTIELVVDGTTIISVTDSTITAAGFAGLTFANGCGNDYAIDSFRAGPPSGGGGGGITHSVSGTGSVSLGALVGVLVQYASIPAGIPIAQGNPTRYFNLGSVAFADSIGNVRQYFLSQQNEIVPSSLPSPTTLYYSFNPGLSVTITELAIL